jgi:hypothetical protein
MAVTTTVRPIWLLRLDDESGDDDRLGRITGCARGGDAGLYTIARTTVQPACCMASVTNIVFLSIN